MMLCGPCRVARYVPFRDNFDLNDQPFRLSKVGSNRSPMEHRKLTEYAMDSLLQD